MIEMIEMKKEKDNEDSIVWGILVSLTLVLGVAGFVIFALDTSYRTDQGIKADIFNERVKHWVVVQNAFNDGEFSVREKNSFEYFKKKDGITYVDVISMVEDPKTAEKGMPVYKEFIGSRFDMDKAKDMIGDRYEDVLDSAIVVNDLYSVMDDGIIDLKEEKLILEEADRLGKDFSSVVRSLEEIPESEIAGVLYREMMYMVNKDRGFEEQIVVRGFGIDTNN